MAQKIIVLQGIPASGKSTWAHEYTYEHSKDTIIVSRDSIRESCGEYWVPEREKLISKIETNTIGLALDNGYNVIIDATNLNDKTIQKWEALAKSYKVDIEYKIFDIDVEEAIARDKERGTKVGEEVIRDFYNKFNNFFDKRKIEPQNDPNKLDCILCDLDGTLALRAGRSPFDDTKYQTDNINFPLLDILKSFDWDEKQIIFLSGREQTEIGYHNTMEWLTKKVGLDSDRFKLLMRTAGDKRPDEIIKAEIYENLIKPKYNVKAIFDDRNKVVKMWRDKGLLCLQVYYGDF